MTRLWHACLVLGSALLISSAGAQVNIRMTEVIFNESEPGLASYTSRLLVNDRFLRIDDGSDSGDFVLYERNSGAIHSINHEEQTHLLIQPGQSVDIEFEVDYSHRENALLNAPRVDGRKPVQHHFYANDTLCRQSVNVSGMLDDVALALREYRQVLAEQSKSTFSQVPPALRTACYMANNYLYVSEYLKVGFPLHMKDEQGRQETLVSYRTVSRPAALFGIPPGYRVYRPQDMRPTEPVKDP